MKTFKYIGLVLSWIIAFSLYVSWLLEFVDKKYLTKHGC